MSFDRIRAVFAVASLLAVTSACSQNAAVVPAGSGAATGAGVQQPAMGAPADTTSILKLLKKDVEVGSTVDPTNGDTGPHSLQMATSSYGKVKKGDFLVCNFANSKGDAGEGTTVELLASAAGSKPATFVQSSKIEGCDGAAVVSGGDVYVSGLTSKMLVECSQNGACKKTYTKPIVDPLADAYGAQPPGTSGLYSPYFVFVGDFGSGSVDLLSLGLYGTGKPLQGVSGFSTSGSGWSALGPSGLAYNNAKGTLYVVDGACNAVVAIDNAPDLLETDEIVVSKNCTSFTCKSKKSTCATLVKSGSPLNKPEAAAILPNGNLIIANTGSNMLVEMTPTGQVLDTEVVDKSKTAGIFGLWATGKNDSDTLLYYTDANSNTVQELEP